MKQPYVLTFRIMALNAKTNLHHYIIFNAIAYYYLFILLFLHVRVRYIKVSMNWFPLLRQWQCGNLDSCWLVRCRIMPLTAGTGHISPGPGEQHHLAGRRRNKPAPLLTNRGQGNNEANQLRGLGELTAENKINIFYGATFYSSFSLPNKYPHCRCLAALGRVINIS